MFDPDDRRPVPTPGALAVWTAGWVTAAVLPIAWLWLMFGGYAAFAGRWFLATTPGVIALAVLVTGTAAVVAGAVWAAVKTRGSVRAATGMIRVGRTAAASAGPVTLLGIVLLARWIRPEEWFAVAMLAAIPGGPALGGLVLCLTGLWGRRSLHLTAVAPAAD